MAVRNGCKQWCEVVAPGCCIQANARLLHQPLHHRCAPKGSRVVQWLPIIVGRCCQADTGLGGEPLQHRQLPGCGGVVDQLHAAAVLTCRSPCSSSSTAVRLASGWAARRCSSASCPDTAAANMLAAGRGAAGQELRERQVGASSLQRCTSTHNQACSLRATGAAKLACLPACPPVQSVLQCNSVAIPCSACRTVGTAGCQLGLQGGPAVHAGGQAGRPSQAHAPLAASTTCQARKRRQWSMHEPFLCAVGRAALRPMTPIGRRGGVAGQARMACAPVTQRELRGSLVGLMPVGSRCCRCCGCCCCCRERDLRAEIQIAAAAAVAAARVSDNNAARIVRPGLRRLRNEPKPNTRSCPPVASSWVHQRAAASGCTSAALRRG